MKIISLTLTFVMTCFILISKTYSTDIEANTVKFNYSVSGFRMYKIGIFESPNELLKPIPTPRNKNKIIGRGDYLLPPPWASDVRVEVDSFDIVFLKSIIKPYIKRKYYDDEIFDFTMSYYDNMRFDIREFYFDFYSNCVYMLLSGCYGKFAHIYVITDFDSKKSFIENANEFFDVPLVKESEVIYEEHTYPNGSTDYYYSYNDKDDKFSLAGFSTIQSGYKDKTVPTREVTIIDLKINAGEVDEK